MADFKRADRLSHSMRQEIYDIVRNLKDPRIPELFSVTYADVTADLRYAKVGVSAMIDEQQRRDFIKALKGAAGFVRRELGARIELRYTPELSFAFDESLERSWRIQNKLGEIASELENSREEGGGDA